MENDNSIKVTRRAFLGGIGALGTLAVAKAQDQVQQYTAAPTDYKEPYPRQSFITPPGSRSHAHFQRHCTGCELCVSACPNQVLTCAAPNGRQLIQPVMSYERGYCRPGCQNCSKVCPTGAIERLPRGAKSSVQIGRAVYDLNACVVITDGVSCGQCVRRCPSGALSLVEATVGTRRVKIPAVNEARCIGCGACEHFCPARPKSAIHVEGNQVHHDF